MAVRAANCVTFFFCTFAACAKHRVVRDTVPPRTLSSIDGAPRRLRESNREVSSPFLRERRAFFADKRRGPSSHSSATSIARDRFINRLMHADGSGARRRNVSTGSCFTEPYEIGFAGFPSALRGMDNEAADVIGPYEHGRCLACF